MSTTKPIQVAILLVVLATLVSALEVRVLTGINMRGQMSPPDSSDQKIVLNSNNRYVYPSHQVP